MHLIGLRELISGVASAGRSVFEARAIPRLSRLGGMCQHLLDLKGEASVVALAHRILSAYKALDEAGRMEFFALLRDRFAADPARVEAAIERYRRNPDADAVSALNDATEAPRQDLFRLLNTAPDGTGALIRMREHLLGLVREHPDLASVDRDLKHLLQSWFNRGFLTIRRIDWQTPASILEKLIAHECVHEIRGWPDLQRRLARDRRCYAFFHPAVPDEPLIFVEVALGKGMADSIQTVLDAPPPAASAEIEADTANFYSINNCLQGLSGISFGNFLIKQVTESLIRDVPRLVRFSTLSPIPGFMAWLTVLLKTGGADCDLSPVELELLRAPPGGWLDDEPGQATVKPLLLHLCAHYLLNAKRGLEPSDSVARFHLRNGARLERLNWLADRSEKGLRESAGLLVNYVYDRKTVAKNREAYVTHNEVACAAQIRALAGKRRPCRAHDSDERDRSRQAPAVP